MQLYFIRHAQSENNMLWDQKGNGEGRSEDPGLTSTGIQQIGLLADFLANNKNKPTNNPGKDNHNRFGFNFTHLYASPMIRAAQTGYSVAVKLKIPLQLWVDLHEGGGIYLDSELGGTVGLPGQNDIYFLEKFPDILLDPSITKNGWWNKPFEPVESRIDRAKRVVAKLKNSHSTNDVIGIFSHGGFFNYFLAEILNQCRIDSTWIDLNNTGITRIDFNSENGRTNIVYVNKVDFLPDNLIT